MFGSFALVGLTLWGIDVGQILLSIDWNQVMAWLLAAIGGGGVINVAAKKGWFAGLIERFRGKPATSASDVAKDVAAINAAAASVDLNSLAAAFADEMKSLTAEVEALAATATDPLSRGIRALRELDELLEPGPLPAAERRKRFLDGLASLLEAVAKPPAAVASS